MAEPKEYVRVNWPSIVNSVVILTIVIIGVVYLNHRQDVGNHRQDIERQGICAIVDTVPVGKIPAVDVTRADFACGPPHPPTVSLSPSPGAS